MIGNVDCCGVRWGFNGKYHVNLTFFPLEFWGIATFLYA